jgi:hypothetical protein
LLQRLLAAHPDIATTAEPWVLLPLFYTTRMEGAYAEYGHRQMVRAVVDFSSELEGGRQEYLRELSDTARRLYSRAAGGRSYFLDKTPRYHLIIRELLEMFPDGEFVLLWRQPLAVAASMIESFGGGRWNLDRYGIDLDGGLRSLLGAWRDAGDRVIGVRYEDVVGDPEAEVVRIWRRLGLDPEAGLPVAVGTRPSGRMGDRTGAAVYHDVSTEPLEKWRRTFGTAYRRRWAARYLRRIGRESIELMGYDFDALERDVRRLPPSASHAVPDILRSGHDRTLQWMARRVTRNSLLRDRRPHDGRRPSS